MTDEEIASDPEAQLKLLQEAYATKDPDLIDQAIYRVYYARRDAKHGLSEWLDEN
ncbi:hypothetical protein [Leisingera aquimarina]|uniref:hypothetical protein n=1 Tax=Leisingera aquimarina TaxID=476529 RepID=UPI0012EC8D21|nr:hypothetical protein [Leisingera aquimarina]|tara:strand:+ start:236 stop:400 length:165 start_codon:yes stop_codon:yes gene_type:complete